MTQFFGVPIKLWDGPSRKKTYASGRDVCRTSPDDPNIPVICMDPMGDYPERHKESVEFAVAFIEAREHEHSNVILLELARYKQELPKLQQRLGHVQSEVMKLRRENAELKQHCESLQKEADVNSRMIDEVVARRVGECFADEGARAIEAILTVSSGIVDLNELEKAMRLSCEDAVELFTMLGWADLVVIKEGKVKLTPRGEKVAKRLDELG